LLTEHLRLPIVTVAQTLRKEAAAEWSAAYQALLVAQADGKNPDYWALARVCWPPLWRWWQWSLVAAPIAALNLLNSRVRSAAELEEERFARQERAAVQRERKARQTLAKAPESASGAMVLGVPLDEGDLPWLKNNLFTYPADSMGRHAAVIGSSGMGKSETVLRLAAGARQTYGWKVRTVGRRDLFAAERWSRPGEPGDH
jgi:hypothetical protein